MEPPRSSVHCVEEEGEGFCDSRQQRNQEIRPKTLNSHPRLSTVVMHTPTQGDERSFFSFYFTVFWILSWRDENGILNVLIYL